MPNIWINAGEISGDVHGGLLAREILRLCPQARLFGMAGPAMRAAVFKAIPPCRPGGTFAPVPSFALGVGQPLRDPPEPLSDVRCADARSA